MHYFSKHIHFKRKITLLFMTVMLLSSVFFGYLSVRADDEAYIKSGTTMLRVRDSAGGDIMKDEAGNPVYLSGDTRVTVMISGQFFGWVFAMGGLVKIIGPSDVLEMFRKECRKQLGQE